MPRSSPALANTHQTVCTYACDILLHSVRRLAVAACLLAAVSCGATTRLAPTADFSLKLGAKHPLVGQVIAGPTHNSVSAELLLQAAGRARYIVLGETHDNPDHHQLQAQLLRRFLEAQPSAAVAFEMLDEEDASGLAHLPESADDLASHVDWAHSG